MTTPSEISVALETVPTASVTGYYVVPVPGATEFRIGRDGTGALVLLTPPEGASNVGPPTQLRRLLVHARARVRVETSDGSVEEETVGIVELRSDAADSAQAFCGIAATMVELIGARPAPGKVRAAFRRVIELFEPRFGRRGSVLGLWGELLCVLESDDAAQMVEAWHVEVDDRFDFAAPRARIEVKTTESGSRVHEFDLGQLLPVEGALSTVVSVVTTATHAGSSVLDLVNEVQERLGGRVDLAVKLWQVVAATVGEDWIADIASARWDRREGVASLRVMHASDVPRVERPRDDAILSVRLRVLCEGVPARPRTISLGTTSG